ncbi:hypothetical protein [Methylobacterium longum]|uniref:hypothetical protein n=1 Tax=Methylobacterium longum TaxID=767694 RepID=UPI002082A5F2|nr:hypothetical protein FOHLNKBM_6347 [Methylobacterium longum]
MAIPRAPRIPDALLDQWRAGADSKTALEADGLLGELKKVLSKRALDAEMNHHLAGEDVGNTHKGYGRKMGSALSGHRPELVTALGVGDPVLRLPR